MKARNKILIDGQYIDYDLIAQSIEAYPHLAPKLRYLGFGIGPIGDQVHAWEFIDLVERARFHERIDKLFPPNPFYL